MAKEKYIKQLTRENTLLERSLRTIAYHTSIKEVGKASISKSPILGRGRITSLYYSPDDYKKQQKIITKEFRGKNIERMGRAMIDFLEKAYLWSKEKEGADIFGNFLMHHARSRGTLAYGYWGEPVITAKLKASLMKRHKLKAGALDHIISILSTPIPIRKPLSGLHKISDSEINKRKALIKKLKLSSQEKELADILSWFTFFYEFGERVSFSLYEKLMAYLKKVIRDKKDIKNLEWYDPNSLADLLRGKKLPEAEIKKRKNIYVLQIKNNKLEVLSGERAEKFCDKNFKEETRVKKINEIVGVIASKGTAKGRVKIIITQDDQLKMNKGDILVSTMTTPYLMGAVKKAAAIITDEGGLTAHAAIVARELKIPCIIGTKIATKVFKDGDLVEVDANKGVVRKIKK